MITEKLNRCYLDQIARVDVVVINVVFLKIDDEHDIERDDMEDDHSVMVDA